MIHSKRPTRIIDFDILKVVSVAGAALALPVAGSAGVITNAGPGLITATNSPFNYDIDGDGTDDFTFDILNTTDPDADPNPMILVTPLGSNGYFNVGGNVSAIALDTQQYIDGGSTTGTGPITLQQSFFATPNQKKKGPNGWFQTGPWTSDGSLAYLGVHFDISGQLHNGWILLSASTIDDAAGYTEGTINIQQSGYESDADTPIYTPGLESPSAAPEPSTLGLLALGAIGLAARRKRRLAA